MAIQLGALRDALLHPGDVERAERAAEELAGYETRLAAIDTRLGILTALIGVLITLQIGFGMGTIWLLVGVMGRLPR